MRNDRDESMSGEQASGVAVAERPQEQEKPPYRAFLDALEELELVVSLHGTASLEADLARADVRRTRELAARTWRERNTA